MKSVTYYELPSDLVPVADDSSLPFAVLAEGSRQAQVAQQEHVEGLRLPLSAQTRFSGIRLRYCPWMGYVGQKLVTQAEWTTIMGESLGDGDTTAPVLVNWENCQRFCRAICNRESVRWGTYKILSPGQWLSVCKADGPSTYFTKLGCESTMETLKRSGWEGIGRLLGNELTPLPEEQWLPNPWGIEDLLRGIPEWAGQARDYYVYGGALGSGYATRATRCLGSQPRAPLSKVSVEYTYAFRVLRNLTGKYLHTEMLPEEE